MEIEIEGMTLAEIKAKFKEYDREGKREKKEYEAGDMRRCPTPSFIPDEEFELAKKIREPLMKAEDDLLDEMDGAASDQEKKALVKTLSKVLDLRSKCDRVIWKCMSHSF